MLVSHMNWLEPAAVIIRKAKQILLVLLELHEAYVAQAHHQKLLMSGNFAPLHVLQ